MITPTPSLAPRAQARANMEASVDANIWMENGNIIETIRRKVAKHPLLKHPILAQLESGMIDIEQLKTIHLEYRHAIVQLFTDALLMAQFQTRQLEPRLPPGSKQAPRFLLTLNILDEFGFTPDVGATGYYTGSPIYAHYPLFEKVLDSLDITASARELYHPSESAQTLNNYLTASFGHYQEVVILLAVAEQQVITFSAPLREALKVHGFDVSQGYYHVHGTSDSKETNAADDDHQDDLWLALQQAVLPEDWENLQQKADTYLDLWHTFWDCHTVHVETTHAQTA
ncbi:iron-containing redox enzyme family protein [Teredinibacter turnerae]|uniref:iron-containing redox enzyme family protein n=1 Tax=Teredinibacter turnerae TaxID=2426 RepID=UPI001E4355A8|nr:iron-containing redox enzyme family protein [Teredinibacter turnerae]